MCRYFSIGFTDLMLKGRSSLDYANLFSPNKYEKNDKIIRSSKVSRENLKTLKGQTFSKKHKLFLLFATCVAMKMKKYLKKKNQLRLFWFN